MTFDFDMVKPFFEYGTPLGLLVFLVWGLIRFGRWASKVIENAIFDPNTGWLAAVNKNANTLQQSVDGTERYFNKLTEQEETQQALCDKHADGLQRVSETLERHIEIARATLTGLEQFRADSLKEDTPYSTTVTNRRLKLIQQAMRDLCETAILAASEQPEVSSQIGPKLTKIKELLSEENV